MNIYNLKKELVAIRCDKCGRNFPYVKLLEKFDKYVHDGYSVIDTKTLECFHLCRECLTKPYCAKEVLCD